MPRRLYPSLMIFASTAASPVVLLLAVWQWLAWRTWRRGLRPVGEVVLVYSQVAWDEVWQRPQEFAWRLARSRCVVYVSPVQVHQWLFTLKNRWRPVRDERPGRQLIVLSPLVFSGHFKSRWINRLNGWIQRVWLAAVLQAAERVHMLANTPFAVPMIQWLESDSQASRPRHGRVVYDVIDDFAAFSWAPAFCRPWDDWLTARADDLVTGTLALREQRSAVRPDAEFIPCGVDYDLFSQEAPEPADLASLPRPIIGYIGSVGERLDFDLLRRLAAEFPAASVVLVGPCQPVREGLPQAANIHYLGLRRHEQLPGYARAFSVATIPFRLNAATVMLNPVKTLEYLAAGVPVVSTALPDIVRLFGDVVRVARTADEFVEHVREVLKDAPSELREAGMARARAASWDAMTDAIARRFSSGVEGRRA
jgi:glycosyltransferase involved in cell wall biosynthesis